MQCQRFLEISLYGVSGGESCEEGVVLSCAEVVLFYFVVVELACEHEAVVQVCAAFFPGLSGLAEGAVGVVGDDFAGGVDDLPDAAEAIVEIEVSIVRMVAVVLGDYLAVSVNIHFLDIVTGIQLHQYYRQIAHDVNNILAGSHARRSNFEG